jgi:hypothetical protein
MRPHEATVKSAIALFLTPSRVRIVRSEALPVDTIILLRIASGDAEALALAAETTEHKSDVISSAATFFVEQILFAPGADSYRILGAHSDAPTIDLRRNMALLLKWLHPDSVTSSQHSVYATRITTAWGDLKTIEGRALYDEKLLATVKPGKSARPDRRHKRRPAQNYSDARSSSPGLWAGITAFLFGRRP